MKKRTSAVILLVVTLLFSAWGNVVAAGFCPRYALSRDCSRTHKHQAPKQVKHDTPCHDEMAGMDMDDMQIESPSDSSASNSPEEFSESSNDQGAVELTTKSCAHCVSHSQSTAGVVSVLAIDPAKRVVESNSLPANSALYATSDFTDLIVPSEHSPPGPTSPRHLIINVFRI